MSYFRTTSTYATAIHKDATAAPAVALVTGGKSGIGLALARTMASWDFVDTVLAVSRSITDDDVGGHAKIQTLQADVGTAQGRDNIVQAVADLCSTPAASETPRKLRFLVHSAGTIDPIKPIWELTSDEMRHSMVVNCEAPLLLTTALYPYLKSPSGVASRVLHVSSGAAHSAPPEGWGAYGISKAAFFQSYKVLEREFRHDGGHVVVGSFRPGVVDTPMQQFIRESPADKMPLVNKFRDLKDQMEKTKALSIAQPPPKGRLDTPENVAFFAEYLLLGTTDEEFANVSATCEYDIRNAELFPRWILPENLP